MLSGEIDKLRAEFERANQERANQPPPPPPQMAPPPPQQGRDPYYDQYFDPTEDPLAFMRGPRRRANSFSGHGGEWRCFVHDITNEKDFEFRLFCWLNYISLMEITFVLAFLRYFLLFTFLSSRLMFMIYDYTMELIFYNIGSLLYEKVSVFWCICID